MHMFVFNQSPQLGTVIGRCLAAKHPGTITLLMSFKHLAVGEDRWGPAALKPSLHLRPHECAFSFLCTNHTGEPTSARPRRSRTSGIASFFLALKYAVIDCRDLYTSIYVILFEDL